MSIQARLAFMVETPACCASACCNTMDLESPSDQTLQRVHVSLIVTRFVDRSLGYERRMRCTWIIQQSTKRLKSNLAFADVLMTIESRRACRFGIITMPNRNVLQTNR